MECEAELVDWKEVECEGDPSTGIRPRGSLWWLVHATCVAGKDKADSSEREAERERASKGAL